MTAKQKAKELSNKYFLDPSLNMLTWDEAKSCALIAVDEMINMAVQYEGALSPFQISNYPEFLKEVKQEIENL